MLKLRGIAQNFAESQGSQWRASKIQMR